MRISSKEIIKYALSDFLYFEVFSCHQFCDPRSGIYLQQALLVACPYMPSPHFCYKWWKLLPVGTAPLSLRAFYGPRRILCLLTREPEAISRPLGVGLSPDELGSVGKQPTSLFFRWNLSGGVLCFPLEVPKVNEPQFPTAAPSLVAPTVKNLPAMQEICVQPRSWEDHLEKGMATHSSILAWRIPWTEELGWLHSMGSQRVRLAWVTNTLPTVITCLIFLVVVVEVYLRLIYNVGLVSGAQHRDSDIFIYIYMCIYINNTSTEF